MTSIAASRTKAARDLRAAAVHLDVVGLHQGSSYAEGIETPLNPNAGKVACCALGAVAYVQRFVSSFDDVPIRVLDVLDEYVRDHYGAKVLALDPSPADNVGRAIATWNDAPGRTKAEVVALMLAAADEVEASAPC